ncbi:MAG: FHA domain-containing protein [Actinobacteria bacterium]|nr:FHA domain-containing protein [Actinomycetota bacterium]
MAGMWLLFLRGTGSVTVATVMLLMLATAVGLGLMALRWLGVDRDHPWVQRMGERPWRDGREVLQLALRHLPEVFIMTPSGSLLAPNALEVLMNPDDFASLTEVMEQSLIDSWACEAYQSCIVEHAARLGGDGPVMVRVASDPDVLAGRYRLRQRRLVGAGEAVSAVPAPAAQVAGAGYAAGAAQAAGAVPAAGGFGFRAAEARTFQASDGRTLDSGDGGARIDGGGARALPTDLLTVSAVSSVPLLRLVTGGSAAETRVSGARAGRGTAVELLLPEEPTVSRVHAKFVFRDGQWRVTVLGRNGLMVNEMPVRGEQVVRDGDLIRWGNQPGALVSRVQLGPA